MYEQIMKRVARTHGASLGNVTEGVDRRDFFKLSVASGFALGLFPYTSVVSAQTAPAAAGLKPIEMPGAFVAIAKDGTVTVQSNRLDMGQGAETGLAMALAEELDADWSKVKAVPAPMGAAYVDPGFGMHLTGGSTAIKNSYTQYRELGARTRAMLVAAAAAQWKVKPEQITVANGVVSSGSKKAGFGELADAAMKLPVPEKVTLKDPKNFKIIGKPAMRIATPDASRGAKQFGVDFKLPGMKTVVLQRPPVFGGKIAKFDGSKAKAVKGVSDVLKIEGLDRGAQAVAVFADGFWPAKQGRDALQIDWDLTSVEKVDSEKQLAQYKDLAGKPGLKVPVKDKPAADASKTKRTITAEYTFPYLAHSAMEPLNCNIEFDGSKCTLWYGAQMHNVDAGGIAKVLGIKPENVAINSLPSGGGFGRRAVPAGDFVIEAAQVAKAYAAAGKKGPLKIMWSREDDTRGGYYRPMTVHRAAIGLDDAGNVTEWKHTIVSQSIIKGSPFEQFMVKDGVDATTVEGVNDTPYNIPLVAEVHHPTVNVPVLWWRSVGHTHTAYAMETLVDEVARATKKDPVALRREWLGSKRPRHLAALNLAVEKSGYGKTKPAAGRAFGVAVHESFATVVAYVVEASLKDGQPVIHSVHAGVHCNLPVNPRSIETQIQGAALMAIGTTLPGAAITLKDGVVQQGNWGEYTIARIGSMPQVTVHIVPSGDAPTGIGEPGLPPLAPALANAIAQITGKTPRSLPFEAKIA
ncbi:MAG: molybdopterin cofactor-binding domain-containing protein [Burkholderiaceae bacterium]